MKMQIHFILRKKFRSTSKEDADSFLFEENSDLHLMKIHIHFCFEKNSDLHLMKIQIRFYADFETKKEIITIIKRIKNMFQQNKLTTHVMNI